MTLIVTDGRILLADKRSTEIIKDGHLRCPQCSSNKARISDTETKIYIPNQQLSKPYNAKFRKMSVLAFAAAGPHTTGPEVQLAFLHLDLYDLLNYFNMLHKGRHIDKEQSKYFPFINSSLLLIARVKNETVTVYIDIETQKAIIREYNVGAVIAIGSGAAKFRTHYHSGGLGMLDAFQLAAYQDTGCNFGLFDMAVIDSGFNVTRHKCVKYKRSIEELIEVYKTSLDEKIKRGKVSK